MAEAVLRVHIPGTDSENPRQAPLVPLQPYRQQNEETTPGTSAISSARPSYVSLNDDPEPRALAVIQDRGPHWSRHAARNDDVYWNIVLVEGDVTPPRRDENTPSYPYCSRTTTPELIGRAPIALTAEQRAELGILRAREKETLGKKEKSMLEKAASKQKKSRKGKERATTPENWAEPTASGSREDHRSTHVHPFRQNFHVGMAHAPFEHPESYQTPRARLLANWPLLLAARTRSSDTLPSSRRSTAFDPTALLTEHLIRPTPPDDDSGARQVSPHETDSLDQDLPPIPQALNLPSMRSRSTTPDTPPQHPRITELQSILHNHDYVAPFRPPSTWNTVLNEILQNPHVDAVSVQRVRQRALANARLTGDVYPNAINATDVGLVPNFSKPNIGAEWNDRWFATHHFQDQDPEWLETAYRPKSASTTSTIRRWLRHMHETYGDDNSQEATEQEMKYLLPNGVLAVPSGSSPSSSASRAESTETCYSDPTHVRPSGLRLAPPPTPTASPTAMLALQENTMATQAHLIATLHRRIDRAIRKTTYYEETLITSLLSRSRSLQEEIADHEEALRLFEQQNDRLWELAGTSKKMLRWCWERDAELARMLGEIRGRDTESGYVRRLCTFGRPNRKRESWASGWLRRSFSERKPASGAASSELKRTSCSRWSRWSYILPPPTSTPSPAAEPAEPEPSRVTSRRGGGRAPVKSKIALPRLKRNMRSNLDLIRSSERSDLEALAEFMEVNMRVLGDRGGEVYGGEREENWGARGEEEG
jgi:hypothetical protein